VRIGVVGAGAIGGATAALLSRAGHDVVVTARGAGLDAIRAGGIRLEGAWGSFTAAVDARPALEAPVDLLVLATKAQDAAAALEQNAPALSSRLVLVVQNGLGGIDTARRVTGRSDLVGGLALYAASHLSPGLVTITAPGITVLGGPGDVTAAVADVLRPAMPVSVSHNFDGALWSKLFINQVNALPAITGLSVQEVVADDRLRRVLVGSMRELVRVARASGIRFDEVQGLSAPLLTAFSVAPLPLAALLPKRMAKRMGSVPNPGSTLQSIRRGQATEVDYLNGPVVEHGRAVGVPTPLNAEIVTMVHEVERSGRFLSVDDVVRRTSG
jgi:2-dehydropantoate 2-reductase